MEIVCRLYGRFTLETIMATAFGRSVDLQHGESDEFVKAAHELFRSDNETNSVSTLIQVPLIGTYMTAVNSNGTNSKHDS